MIPVKTHNILDYCLGVSFLVAPFVFGLDDMYFARDVFAVLGLAVIGYSLLTDYTHALIKAVPLGMHMSFDIAVGAFAVLAPWIYGYRDELTTGQMIVHWVMGIAAVAIVFMTDRAKEPPVTVLEPRTEVEEALDRKRRAA